MDERFQRETENLVKSWTQHAPEMLRDYLVSGVEDPRINLQSILARHALLVAIADKEFAGLMDQELRFAAVANWLLNTVGETANGTEDLLAIRHALMQRADDAEGIAVPRFVSAAFHELPMEFCGAVVPNYLRDWLGRVTASASAPTLDGPLLSTFEQAWHQVLADRDSPGLTVLEVACGSANDYRFFERFGLARLIDYTGLDLCETNINNARQMFPDARFEVGNALDLQKPDAAFEFCFAQDLFEHLSLEAVERALDEICRVTKSSLCLGFFNLHEGEEHRVQAVNEYHWNQLSVPRLREGIERRGFQTQVLHVGTFLKWRIGCPETHNQGAYTFFAERTARQGG